MSRIDAAAMPFSPCVIANAADALLLAWPRRGVDMRAAH